MASVPWSDLMANAEGGPTPIPAGEYETVVDKATAKKTSKGKDMFSVKFKVVGGPHDGHVVWSNFTISPESPVALGIFFRQLNALGLDGEFFGAGPSPEAVAGALVGRRARLTLEVGEYQGQAKNEVKGVKPSTSAVPAAPGSAATVDPVVPPAPAEAPSPPAAGGDAPPKPPF